MLDNRNGDNTSHQSYNEHQLKKAFATLSQRNIPIHINAPFDEPLYEQADEKQFQPLFETLDVSSSQLSDTSDFLTQWNQAKRKMILVGCLYPDRLSKEWIEYLAADASIIVLTEATSNLHHKNFFEQIDALIAPIEKLDNADTFWQKLQPELLLTFGGMIVSKKIKAFLRKYPPKRHFHVDPFHANDTFFCLSKHFKTTIDDFFNSHKNQLKYVTSDYQKFWLQYKSVIENELSQYLEQIDHSDLTVFDRVIKRIPEDYLVHFANSSSIRYANLFSFKNSHEVFSNRGTSGIDGSTSTAIGAALMSEKPGLLITGDLSFFYDSNALWNDHIPYDFKVIVINNSGGGIFRILPGEKEKAYYQRYFETTHQLTAEHLCKMYGFEYHYADNEGELDQCLSDFFLKNDQPQLLEIKTPRTVNDEVLLGYFSFLAERCF
jgi:2-succinyl-5-enolpyruvyl-6-hydroxy-3-cyclohexene-1-carboxylate synthase